MSYRILTLTEICKRISIQTKIPVQLNRDFLFDHLKRSAFKCIFLSFSIYKKKITVFGFGKIS